MALEVGTNSYISVEDANTYFEDRLGAEAWPGSDKDKALIAATGRIDRLRLVGIRRGSLQPLQFPRCYTIPAEGRPFFDTGEMFDLLASPASPEKWDCEEEVPKAVLDAVCEEALALVERQGDAQASLRSKLQRQGVSSVKIGSTSETYRDPGEYGKEFCLYSQEAEGLMAPYVASVGAFG